MNMRTSTKIVQPMIRARGPRSGAAGANGRIVASSGAGSGGNISAICGTGPCEGDGRCGGASSGARAGAFVRRPSDFVRRPGLFFSRADVFARRPVPSSGRSCRSGRSCAVGSRSGAGPGSAGPTAAGGSGPSLMPGIRCGRDAGPSARSGVPGRGASSCSADSLLIASSATRMRCATSSGSAAGPTSLAPCSLSGTCRLLPGTRRGRGTGLSSATDQPPGARISGR